MKGLSLKILPVAALILALMAIPEKAASITLGFTTVTGDPFGIQGQLLVDVEDDGGGIVKFTFTNSASIASSITDVYFDDGSISTLSGIASIGGSPGVSYSSPAAPPILPGGSNFSVDFSADSNSPMALQNGVNQSTESLVIYFTLQSGRTFGDVLAELASNDLRVGLHVQGIGPLGQRSDAFINGPPPPIRLPLPGTLLLFCTGLLAGGIARWRRNR